MTWRAGRKIAAAVNRRQPAKPAMTYRAARVTAVNAGPPPTVDLLIEDRWPVAGVPYHDHIDTPAVDDEVDVVTYGTGRRIVVGRRAT